MSYPLPNIGKPATNALQTIQVTTLEDVSQLNEADLVKLHGVGPKAIEKLKIAMSEVDLSFSKKASDLSFEPDFRVSGDLACDNAPKRRIIRDFLIASYMPSKSLIETLVSEDIYYQITAERDIYGLDNLTQFLSDNSLDVSYLKLSTILSHGKVGSAHGEVILKSGNKIYFGAFVNFQSHKKDALIQEVTLFIKESSVRD